MTPKRIQRKRIKGWRMPENTVYVGRGSKWGNPYIVVKKRTGGYMIKGYGRALYGWKTYAIDRSVELYRKRVAKHFHPLDIKELKGKNLACWCPLGHSCHADVLLEIAGRPK